MQQMIEYYQAGKMSLLELQALADMGGFKLFVEGPSLIADR